MKVEKVNPQEGLFSRDFLDNFLFATTVTKCNCKKNPKYYCNIICH